MPVYEPCKSHGNALLNPSEATATAHVEGVRDRMRDVSKPPVPLVVECSREPGLWHANVSLPEPKVEGDTVRHHGHEHPYETWTYHKHPGRHVSDEVPSH